MKPLVVAALLVACSAPGPIPELAEAERQEKAGDRESALRSYHAAQDSCRRVRDLRRRRAACSEAYLGRAELLVDLDRRQEAVRAFEDTAAALGADDPASAARATLRAGQIRLDLGDDKRAYALLWRVVTEWPDEAFAGDALVVLLRDGRARDAAQLYDVLSQLHARIGSSQIGDNLLYAMADLAERERGDRALARTHLDRIPVDHPKSGLCDDAWWHAARLSRELGDAAGAAARLRALLATREVAFGAGSYFSVWLDDAQLLLGRILRDDLHRLPDALAAFELLPEHYPASVLKDDALWERAVTLEAMGDAARACAALADLAKKYPDSRWELGEAPARRQRLGCR
jgi:tetratricopeptide (TPR) repeat protein